MTIRPADQPGKLSIIVPVFNEEPVLEAFYHRILSVLQSMDMDHELIFIDDGSNDDSSKILTQFKQADEKIRIIVLSRNFGHQVAITAGIDFSNGDAVVIMDADLQDPPELIPDMVEKWRMGYDVVYGKRQERIGDGLFKIITAGLFYRILNRLADIAMPLDAGDFRLLDRSVVDYLKQFKERHRYLRGMTSWIGFKQCPIEYARSPRYRGQTKYPLFRMLKLSIDGIVSFSSLPLKAATWLGFLSAGFSFLYILYSLYQKYIAEDVVPGWTSIVVAVFFLGGVQLICMGILGEYIGRIYDESKKRPLYIIDKLL